MRRYWSKKIKEIVVVATIVVALPETIISIAAINIQKVLRELEILKNLKFKFEILIIKNSATTLEKVLELLKKPCNLPVDEILFPGKNIKYKIFNMMMNSNNLNKRLKIICQSLELASDIKEKNIITNKHQK